MEMENGKSLAKQTSIIEFLTSKMRHLRPIDMSIRFRKCIVEIFSFPDGLISLRACTLSLSRSFSRSRGKLLFAVEVRQLTPYVANNFYRLQKEFSRKRERIARGGVIRSPPISSSFCVLKALRTVTRRARRVTVAADVFTYRPVYPRAANNRFSACRRV